MRARAGGVGDHLRNATPAGKRANALRARPAQAQERLENSKLFDGGANLVAELPPPGADHRSRSAGTSQVARGGRCAS
eukprot:7348597-Lingulodinium_polyedra.AAC.1